MGEQASEILEGIDRIPERAEKKTRAVWKRRQDLLSPAVRSPKWVTSESRVTLVKRD